MLALSRGLTLTLGHLTQRQLTQLARVDVFLDITLHYINMSTVVVVMTSVPANYLAFVSSENSPDSGD